MEKEQSTRTSSPYSCVSCKNIGAIDHISKNERLEAEVHDLVYSSTQPESKSADVQSFTNNKSSIHAMTLDERQETPLTAGADTSNDSQSEPPTVVLPSSPMSTTVDQYTHGGDLTYPTASVDDLDMSKSEELELIETSRSTAGLGLRQDCRALHR